MSHTLTASPTPDIPALLLQLAILLITARMLGELAQRCKQPAVVGEILAGIVLGPSLLSGLFPAFGAWFIPNTPIQGHLLALVSLIGVMFFLLTIGLETDVSMIRKQARSALGVALGGLVIPLIVGFFLGQFVPDTLLVNPDHRIVFALFMAIAMSISAIPVIAKVLMDLSLIRRTIGQTVIASAMIDDLVGWILLSIVIGMASGQELTLHSVGLSVLTVTGFMLVSLTLGLWAVKHLFNSVQSKLRMPDKQLTLIVTLMLIWGTIGHALGIEALLGAFTVGIIFAQIPQLNSDTVSKLKSISLGIFTPIFFAASGLKVDVIGLLKPDTLLLTVLVIGIAISCKMIGVYLGARFIGKDDHWTAVFYGAGLNARGSMGIIVANIGFSLQILSQDMFSIITVMALFTSLMTPVIMKIAVKRIDMHDQQSETGAEEKILLVCQEENRQTLPTYCG
ncbi:MAG: sodium/hydrogen exchanger [Vampirovibrio sp.]|nr:sodium/hydrogen exchanger [Vampirovibrio sp.]